MSTAAQREQTRKYNEEKLASLEKIVSEKLKNVVTPDNFREYIRNEDPFRKGR